MCDMLETSKEDHEEQKDEIRLKGKLTACSDHKDDSDASIANEGSNLERRNGKQYE